MRRQRTCPLSGSLGRRPFRLQLAGLGSRAVAVHAVAKLWRTDLPP